MKQVVGCICGMAAAGLVFLFCVHMLFESPVGLGLAEKLAQIGYQAQSKAVQTANPNRLEELILLPPPEVRSMDKVCVTGRREEVFSFLQVRQNSNAQWSNPSEAEGIEVKLLDVTNQRGESVWRKIKEAEWEADEIEIPVSYFVETNELCFHESGCYVLKIEVVGEGGRYCTVKITVPVEVE